jgi:F420-dependent oxidoreductase-like protein
VKIGVIVPQGWTGEFDGWDAARAWSRTRDVAWQAESLGFESIWVYDHFHTTPTPQHEITFESFTSLSALAAHTQRVRLGHIVLCAGYRNPALTAKMISTLDVISGGRAELGIGAGWKRDEWEAYGYGFPARSDRLGALGEQLQIIRAMVEGSPATFSGRYHSISNAINVPRPLQQRLPIVVGGNGPNVTWRLAARYADELNLDGLSPTEVAQALPTVRARCEEIGRDPASLRVSIHVWRDDLSPSGQQRIDLVGAYEQLGLSRLIGLVAESADSDDALAAWAHDARAAGAQLADSYALGA